MSPGHARPDLSVFHSKKMPWSERLKLINATFPTTVQLDWKKLFDADTGLLGDLVNDIIKADQAVPGRPGKRAAVEPAIAKKRLRVMMGEDYSHDPFPVAFRLLAGDRSIRNIASKVALDRNLVYRLLKGDMEADAYMMETISKAFGRDPSYFVEYRVAWIVGLLAMRLEGAPEASVHFYRKLKRLGPYGG